MFWKESFIGMVWYGMVRYPMLWYSMESMVCYEISMLCYEISMLCYTIVYVVKDKHSATVSTSGNRIRFYTNHISNMTYKFKQRK